MITTINPTNARLVLAASKAKAIFYALSIVMLAAHAFALPVAQKGVTMTPVPNPKYSAESASTNPAAASQTAWVLNTNELSIADNLVSINSGFYLLNPYKITNTNQLSSSGSSKGVFFIGFGLDYVSMWNPERRFLFARDYLNATNQFDGWSGVKFQFCDKDNKFTPLHVFDTLDFQGRLQYFIQGSSEVNASTIVGSGDFSGEVTLGIPIALGIFTDPSKQYWQTSEMATNTFYLATVSAHSIDAVISYGATTDDSTFDVHHRIFAGLGYKGAYKCPFGSGDQIKREVLVNIQVGCAWIESTRFTDADSNTIFLSHGVPKYFLEPGAALEAEFDWPLTKSTYLSVGTRIYGNHHPGQWNAFLGITFDPGQFLSAFK